ncbi:hypothetical protein WJX73_001166 [Symbiochloris irregularis]|uniref:Uncharacterized protein n=1 Tax=Symbiochloris irregularis TaxID=706552 RepID=A0AAW1NZZ0_9CHLO
MSLSLDTRGVFLYKPDGSHEVTSDQLQDPKALLGLGPRDHVGTQTVWAEGLVDGQVYVSLLFDDSCNIKSGLAPNRSWPSLRGDVVMACYVDVQGKDFQTKMYSIPLQAAFSGEDITRLHRGAALRQPIEIQVQMAAVKAAIQRGA